MSKESCVMICYRLSLKGSYIQMIKSKSSKWLCNIFADLIAFNISLHNGRITVLLLGSLNTNWQFTGIKCPLYLPMPSSCHSNLHFTCLISSLPFFDKFLLYWHLLLTHRSLHLEHHAVLHKKDGHLVLKLGPFISRHACMHHTRFHCNAAGISFRLYSIEEGKLN
jgi:hypothetical protein